jgi:hypothetical protein
MFDWLSEVRWDESHNLYNGVETVWWTVVAVALACRPTPPRASGYRWALVVVLLAFAASDVWELKTGAWWRPWPLCVLKFACGGGGSLLALLWWRAERRDPAAGTQEHAAE